MAASIFPVPLSGIQETLIDAKGDILTATAADTPTRLAVGTNNHILTADSAEATGLKWAAAPVTLTGSETLTNKTLTSPALTTPTISTTTTNGDLLYGTGSGALARLGIGSTNQVLGVTSGVPAYQASSKSTLTTTGDILYASAANTPARLAAGTSGYVLTSGGASTAPSWAAASSGGMTLLSTTATTSGTTIRIQSISQDYKALRILLKGIRGATAGVCRLYFNNTQSGGYFNQIGFEGTSSHNPNSQSGIALSGSTTVRFSDSQTYLCVTIDDYTTTSLHTFMGYGMTADGGGPKPTSFFAGAVYSPIDAVTEINLKFDTAVSFTAGSVEIYGVK